MKYDQHNFVITTTSNAEDMIERMDEVRNLKAELAKHFISHGYKFAIVGEDITSSDLRVSCVINFIVSVIPKCSGTIPLIDEEHTITNEVAYFISTLGYRCIVAGEDMMSELAKDKIAYIPKDENVEC